MIRKTAAGSGFSLRSCCTDEVCVTSLRGELDLRTGSLLLEHVDTLAIDGYVRVLMDLSSLAFVDAAGVSAFIVARRRLLARGGWLGLIRPQPRVLRVLRLLRLEESLVARQAPDGVQQVPSFQLAGP